MTKHVAHAVPGLLIASLLVASCAQAPEESSDTADITMVDRLDVPKIVANRASAISLIGQPLADAQSHLSSAAVAMMRASLSGPEVLSFIISCSMPECVVLTATVDNIDWEFFGAFGLTPQWRTGPLDLAGQRWISACLFARANAHSVAIGFSARGPNLALTVDNDERAFYSLEEGAFYGNLFVPLSQPIQWFACRGRNAAQGEAGDLQNRDCADPDPAKPGLTQCGFVFTGDCGDFATDRACESFSINGTYYKRCHTAPSHNGQWTSPLFEQVITTFVAD